ncbi:unnamed protein product [Ilex paraguariensis]|uniref:Uncharacterized protein n=1 Tax=Ilex paraguariensis TaxID=185542 RepID=A0ABC8RV64_9AQUA
MNLRISNSKLKLMDIPESAEVSSSNKSDHALLSSCMSKGIFKKQDIGSNRGSIPSTIVLVDNLGYTKQTIQEKCQTRATEAEHNLAYARSEDGANHTTTKSPTSRVDPSCDALNDLSSFLELSPRSRNKAFPPLSDLATLNSIPGICGDQNLDNDIIGALFDDNDRSISIFSDSGEILPLVDGENANPCEGEVNSKTNPTCAIQARQEIINNYVMNTLPEPYEPGETRSPRLMLMFSSVSGISY